MLRAPRQRLLSAFYAGLHSGGKKHMASEYVNALYSNVTCPAAFARFEGISNCQAKMLIGCQCWSVCHGVGRAGPWSKAHARALTTAQRVLAGVFVVGLTESFNESVRRLRYALGLPEQALLPNFRLGVGGGRGGSGDGDRGSGGGGGANSRGSGGASSTGLNGGGTGGYDERQLDISHINTWSVARPWSRCEGIGEAPFVRWATPSAELEALDQSVYETALQRFHNAEH